MTYTKKRHREYYREYMRAKRASDPQKHADAVRAVALRRYGLTLDDYYRILKDQGEVCAICRRPETVQREGQAVWMLAMDHDRKTNQFRGLLCVNCNNGLGRFDDDPVRLEAAAAYLRQVSILEAIPLPAPPRPKAVGCHRGHPWTEENTYFYQKPGGYRSRRCRICEKERFRVRRAKL